MPCVKAGASVDDGSKEWRSMTSLYLPPTLLESTDMTCVLNIQRSGPCRGASSEPRLSHSGPAGPRIVSTMICQKPIVSLTDILSPDGGCTTSLELLTPHLPGNRMRVGPIGAELTDADDVGSVADSHKHASAICMHVANSMRMRLLVQDLYY